MDDKELADAVEQINKQIDMIIADTSVPKNVRSAVGEAKARLNDTNETDFTVRVSGAIYSIDGVSNDINLPPQARTMLWNVLSMLESLKE
ncbi:MAG: UPF0147 family protein [Candidatus Micrarchaeaceae archaeon]